MPNWCYTIYVFHGNEKEITDFHDKLQEYTSKNYMKNGFGTNWLGNILCGAGLGDRIDADTNRISCRGSVEFIDDIESHDDDSILKVGVESAWCPAVSMWIHVLEALEYNSIEFSFCAEETGCELYAKYDPFGDFEDKYYVDMFLAGEDKNNDDLRNIDHTIYYISDSVLIADLQRLLRVKDTDIEELIKKAHAYPFKDEDSYLNIHTYEDVNIDDYE